MANSVNGMPELLRARLGRPETIPLPGCYDVLSALVQAGADAVIIDGLRSMEAVRRVGREVPGDKQLNLIFGGKTPILTVDQAQEAGFKILLYSTPALYVTAHALRQWMPALRQARDLKSLAGASLQFDEFQQLIEKSYRERKYLR